MIFLLVLEAFLLAVCLLTAVFFVTEICAALATVAPFVPVPGHAEEKILEHLRLSEGSVLYDLGCGDGRLLLKAVERFPGITAIGIERAWRPYLLARFKTRNSLIQIRRGDFFQSDLSDATHIFFYLFPGIPDRLLSIMKKQCTPGTRIISCDFPAEAFVPSEIISIESPAPRGKKLFVYTV
jgi:SAM-dependent methyltransferase